MMAAAPLSAEDVGELALAQHRVDGHGDCAELPGRDEPDRELWDVLQVERDAVRPARPRGRPGRRRGASDAASISPPASAVPK
jgi:hypothetical protein